MLIFLIVLTCLQKDSLKELSPFHKILTKFLATNTLQSVCPWLADIVAHDIRVPLPPRPKTTDPRSGTTTSSPAQQFFVYRPSLFAVTTRPLSTFIQMNPDPRAVQHHFAGAPVGYYWQTMETGDEVYSLDCPAAGVNDTTADIQTTMSLIYEQVGKNKPMCVCVIRTSLSLS